MKFQACEFVKEDSCLLGELGKVFDLAEQQGLPGRDAQMAKVKQGAEAVAKRLETDARHGAQPWAWFRQEHHDGLHC